MRTRTFTNNLPVPIAEVILERSPQSHMSRNERSLVLGEEAISFPVLLLK